MIFLQLPKALQGSPGLSWALLSKYGHLRYIFFKALQGSPGLSRALQGSPELFFEIVVFWRKKKSFQLSKALQGSPGLLYQNFDIEIMIFHSCPGLSWALLGSYFKMWPSKICFFLKLTRALLGSPGLSRALLGSSIKMWQSKIYFSKALQGSPGLSRALLGSPGLLYQNVVFWNNDFF